MARVELDLSPLPSHVRTARLIVVAAARRAGLPDELVDELRLAVGEASARAVGLHQQHAPGTPVVLSVTDEPRLLTVTVTDRGPAASRQPGDVAEVLWDLSESGPNDLVDPDVALYVLAGLVDDCSVDATPSGTTVTLRWPLPASNGPVGVPSTQAAERD
ncbi:MAG: ATP-binding protein [Mycobacteriales bacterium]